MKTKIIFIGLIFLLSAGCSSKATSDKSGKAAESLNQSGAAYAQGASSAEAVKPVIPSEMTLDDAIIKRRSMRTFAPTPLSSEQLLALAWAGQGITEPTRGFRTAPSAGALYPLELYLVTADGVLHYIPSENRLEPYLDGDLRKQLSEAAVGQEPVAKATVAIVFVGVVERTSVKYKERAERYVLIEIGHAAQNILLKAVAMGLGGVPIGAFYDDQLATLLKLPDGYHPYYILCIGYPEQMQQQAQGSEAKPEKISQWTKPRTDDRQSERDRMVGEFTSGAIRPTIKDAKVLEAMRNVPRHSFVPDSLKKAAYQDSPLPIGYGQTISQPYIVAYMTELLNVVPDDRVLEIGTGSGYQAAVLAELTPYVFTIEIVDELAKRAGKTLKDIGYETVQVRSGDGYFGWEEKGPFDGIIVTCAAGHIPPPLLQQLKPGGKMVVPIGGPYENQRLMVVTKDEKGNVSTRDELPVVFVPMTGRAEEGQ